jgi:ATP-dependent Clp protease ATP-binding subunit ClpA
MIADETIWDQASVANRLTYLPARGANRGFRMTESPKAGLCKRSAESWLDYLAGLEDYLNSRILGQSQALKRITRTVQSAELGFNDFRGHPKASFLFLGPTGVGKTESAKNVTDYLYDDQSRLEVFYMNEYTSETRLGEFLQRLQLVVEGNPEGTVILFDEIEKAYPRLIDAFLSILDEGVFTSISGKRFSLESFYLVLTSNLGSGDLAKMENAPYSTMERVALDIASQSLRPELFARITERIVFKPLGLEVQKGIIEKLVEHKLAVLSEYFNCELTIDRGPVIALLLRHGYNRNQGVRMLEQEVDRQLNQACLRWALANQSPVEGRFYNDTHAGVLVLK